ncbi:MAG: bifunctional nicotinamide-nucleotide adenylyltransferase/Nudix hydroxylase [Undibacterium sp.]|nr:bifunctional nicotinamide-nucleotide adenylyltransferase/Nudix hydroxylase [Undibacterium sp.]
MNTSRQVEVAVLIGRFQPFHNGHASLLRLALDTAAKVVIVIGSSFHARSTKNPFTWQERATMIAETLPESERGRVSYIAMRDYYDDTRWTAAVCKQVELHASAARHIALIGHFKDASSYYLHRFPQWHLIAVDEALDVDALSINATSIRKVLFEAENIDVSLAVIDQHVPLCIRQYLRAWSLLPHYAALASEHAQLMAYKATWSGAPYPPVFSTADAVVKADEHVLLIQRGGFPGKGLWALPGGFIEQDERVIQAAIRELREETKLAVLTSTLENALLDVKVFDHPGRSQRGRTITHAHFFDLKTEYFPDVEGADDAATASWVPIANLRAMEEHFFDDHFHILDCFLGLTINDA